MSTSAPPRVSMVGAAGWSPGTGLTLKGGGGRGNLPRRQPQVLEGEVSPLTAGMDWTWTG